MLGVRLNPTTTTTDVHLKAAAERMGVGDTFHMAPVGVFFGDGEDADGKAKAKPDRRCPTRTSAGRGRRAGPAPSAASA
ncbi:GMC family oxidoreductase [Streptomyces hirsutus]